MRACRGTVSYAILSCRRAWTEEQAVAMPGACHGAEACGIAHSKKLGRVPLVKLG